MFAFDVNVLIPSGGAGNCNAKAFSLIYVLELMALEGAWKGCNVPFTSDVDDLTLSWVEFHHPSHLPFIKSVQILL